VIIHQLSNQKVLCRFPRGHADASSTPHKPNLVDEPEDAPLHIEAITPANRRSHLKTWPGGGGKKKSKQGVALCVCVSRLLVLAVGLLRNLLTPFPRRGFRLLSSRHHRLKTFAKRTFPRWRALPLGRDLTRVRPDAMGFARSPSGSSLPLRYH
jgi:hypothetical protein